MAKPTVVVAEGQVPKDGARKSKPQWFGSAVTAATNASVSIPCNPFPEHLRAVMTNHLDKAKRNRQQALDAIKRATTESQYETVMNDYVNSPLSKEGTLSFDTQAFPLREAFLTACGLSSSIDLSRLHDEEGVPEKLQLLKHLTTHPLELQTVYDEFVRHVCCPKLAELWDCQGEICYQCFPCLRIVQPGDFSIGPHADVAYGHHPLTTNFYVLLTDLTPQVSSAALFLESTPGAEDWHPILGKYGEMVKHFPGGSCAHWTAENNTSMTRVSLDFRLIPGPLYHAMVDGGSEKDGKMDVFRKTEGYYNQCRLSSREDDNSISNSEQWERIGPLLAPDARVGFPWTVSNWERLLADQEKRRRGK